MDFVAVSKRLSYVLRHRPDSVALTLDPNGWVAVDDLLAALAAHGRPVSRAELDAVVAGNDKRRFAVQAGPDGRDRIRASQGHSIPVDLGLDAVTPPPVLFHGTSAATVPAIRAEGLRKGRRHHVHLSSDRATAHRVGARRRGGRSQVSILEIDAATMAADGYPFYRSANGVWLTDHVPPEYLR
ncbi:RNA 2'-phosphotransferase [Planosporangium mesophilum]|uniref:Probable RNA 2'-phosphotransferase n=1 Tax=Planosporangium mesophilum TaxID=689768 RepID=A0A8J3TEL9_9ACTN|nr:putative RNA 2'-phosphotransferase [Planosporangium mesophilum]